MKKSFIFIIMLFVVIVGYILLQNNKNTSITYNEKISSLSDKSPNDVQPDYQNGLSNAKLEKDEYEIDFDKAKRHKLLQWQASLGNSKEQREAYKSYDLQTLLELAKQNDVIALELAAGEFYKNGQVQDAYDMRLKAAALGSTRALFSNSTLAIATLENISSGYESENFVREDYNMPDYINVKEVLERVALSNYVVAAMRGDVDRARFKLKDYQREYRDNEPFTLEEWQTIATDADELYQTLTEARNSLGLNSFDNSYPEAYAHIFELPKENTDPIGYLEKQLVQ